MATEKRYNGWTNYETWAVKLWLDNDERSQSYWLETAREIEERAEATVSQTADRVAVHELADRLKEEHEENAPETAGVYADLLGAALSSVDWVEIAESLIEDAKELAD